MVRTVWCGLVVGAGVLSACGPGDASADREANPATAIGPATEDPAAPADDDWLLPAGVFRAVTPEEGTLELHVEPGHFAVYVIVDGAPELGYAADCVPDDASTITCTGRDGSRLVFGWDGTDEALTFDVLSGGEQGDVDVWEPVPWTRVS